MRLNPFHFRVSFIRMEDDCLVGGYESQSLSFQGFIHTPRPGAIWTCICVSIPFISGFHSYFDCDTQPKRPLFVSIPFISGFHSYKNSFSNSYGVGVSIPFISGFHSYGKDCENRSWALRLNPFHFRVSFIRHERATYNLFCCLNPFHFRVSFIRRAESAPGRHPASQSLSFQGFIHTPSFVMSNGIPAESQSLSFQGFIHTSLRPEEESPWMSQSLSFQGFIHTLDSLKNTKTRHMSQSLSFQGFIHT